MTPLLTADVLDAMRADTSLERPALTFTQTCHPTAGVRVLYTTSGVLALTCPECGVTFAQVAVGEAVRHPTRRQEETP